MNDGRRAFGEHRVTNAFHGKTTNQIGVGYSLFNQQSMDDRRIDIPLASFDARCPRAILQGAKKPLRSLPTFLLPFLLFDVVNQAALAGDLSFRQLVLSPLEGIVTGAELEPNRRAFHAKRCDELM